MAVYILLVLLLATITLCVQIEIPSYLRLCKRWDPQMEQCLLKTIDTLRPHLREGIKELGVPPMEPLFLPIVELADGKDAAKLRIIGRNITVHGTSNFSVQEFKFKRDVPRKPEFHMKLTFPHLELDGSYDLSARIVLLPLKGKGNIHVNVTDIFVDGIIYGQLYKRNNKDYMKFIQIDLALVIKDFDIRLENLFGNQPTLALVANRVIRDNKEEMRRMLTPVITSATSNLLLDITNKISKQVDYDTLFPE